MARLLYELLPTLRRERGLSQMGLALRTAGPEDQGVSMNTIQDYEKPSRAGVVPELEILEALARGLEIEPERFYEYPIAAARRRARPGRSQRRVSRPRISDAVSAEIAQAAEDAAQALETELEQDEGDELDEAS